MRSGLKTARASDLTETMTEFESVAREEAFLEPVELGAEIDMRKQATRNRLVREYAWAIPNEDALQAIAARGPIVELGASGGYWTYLLRTMGVDVVAYDPELWFLDPRDPSVPQKPRIWSDVILNDHTAVERHPDRTLFLCWPSHDFPWAAEALEMYAGDTVAYVGEWRGCTADEDFHDRLADGWEKVEQVAIPQFYFVHDSLMIWERR